MIHMWTIYESACWSTASMSTIHYDPHLKHISAYVPHIPKSLCSPVMFPCTTAPQTCIQKSLYSLIPMFPIFPQPLNFPFFMIFHVYQPLFSSKMFPSHCFPYIFLRPHFPQFLCFLYSLYFLTSNVYQSLVPQSLYHPRSYVPIPLSD